MRLLPAAVAALGARLRNLSVRDLDLVEVEEANA
jgi:hypothetical protein